MQRTVPIAIFLSRSETVRTAIQLIRRSNVLAVQASSVFTIASRHTAATPPIPIIVGIAILVVTASAASV